MAMKIGIFGGSFNPVHKGHLKVAAEAIKQLRLNELYFVPTFQSPFKSSTNAVAAGHRINMLRLVLGSKMRIDDFEVANQEVSYTIKTVQYFQKMHPGAELFLLIGSDLLPTLHLWKQIDEIAKSARIVVFRRDENFAHQNTRRYECLVLDNDVYEFASSWFRAGKIKNVEKNVLHYIADHYLYITDILASMLDEDRLAHCLNASNIAREIAESINYDVEEAGFAALVHDATKDWSNDEHRAFLKSQDVTEEIKDYLLHSETAYYWLKNEYQVRNERILNAVRRHTGLGPTLTTLDKIVFAADKLEGFLKSPRMQEIFTLIKTDFESGFKAIVRTYHDRLILKVHITPEVEATYQQWM